MKSDSRTTEIHTNLPGRDESNLADGKEFYFVNGTARRSAADGMAAQALGGGIFLSISTTLSRPLDTHLPFRLGVATAELRIASLISWAVGILLWILRYSAAKSTAAPVTWGVATTGRRRGGRADSAGAIRHG